MSEAKSEESSAGGATLNALLAPCPFCGAGETRIDETTHWTGMRSVVVSARVMHWCPRKEGQPQSLIQIAGRDAGSAAAAWNERVGANASLSRGGRTNRGTKYERMDWR